ncbi:MAG: hypothetical protein AB1568_13025 [Thermodesulfobacteriota bacterium]
MAPVRAKIGRVLVPLVALLLSAGCIPLAPGQHAAPAAKHPECIWCHDAGYDLHKDGMFCLDCHGDFLTNHHPVDFSPPESEMLSWRESSLPLYDGKIQCLTCHAGHHGGENRETLMLLRGGEYPDFRQFCFKCHYQEKYAAIDIHQMLDDGGNFRQLNGRLVCSYCHIETPHPDKDTTYDVHFRADAPFLCWRCHPAMPGNFFHEHFLVKPSEKVLARKQQYEQEHTVILPLVPRGKISCSTCHNPHQKGVLSEPAAARGADYWARLRLRPTELCLACHRM